MNIFTPLNNLIADTFSAGHSDLVYNLWIVMGYVVVLLFCLIYRKHYGYGVLKSVIITFLLYLLGTVLIRFIGWAESGFTSFGANNIVKGYSFYPLLGLLVAKLFKTDFKRVMDFTAPAFPMTQFVCHIACIFAGCCYGYPMENGIWNPLLNDYLFPEPLLESFVALLVTIACICIAKKNDYKVTGRIYPCFLIMFGGTRFFLEFLRNNPKLFWGISDLALWALLMVVVGIVWLVIDKEEKSNK